MRIISGEFKGRKIEFISDSTTRPTAEVVREALFTKLQFHFPIQNCLDLFAGSGSLGLEAMSRGVSHQYFVEQSRKNAGVVETNLKHFNVEYDRNSFSTTKRASLILGDYLSALNNFNLKFDLILIDPPYASEFYEKALNMIAERGLLSDDGVIVLEHNIERKFENLPFEIISQKRYGKRMLTYLGK